MGTTNLPSVYRPFSSTCSTSKSDGDGTKLLNYQIYRLPPTQPYIIYIYIYKRRFCVDVLFMRSFTYSGSVDWMCTDPPAHFSSIDPKHVLYMCMLAILPSDELFKLFNKTGTVKIP